MNAHKTVCKRSAVAGLSVRPKGVYVDGTLGLGGHSIAIATRLGPQGVLVGIDRDPQALALAKQRLAGVVCRLHLVQANACDLPAVLQDLGLPLIDGCVFDWGISSWQLEQSGRGFAYQCEEPLDMRLDPTQELTAAEILNAWTPGQLVEILQQYGEEYRFARRIAAAVVRARPLTTTVQLAEVVRGAVPYRPAGHPARKTFQALRIAVNEELSSLRTALEGALAHLRPGGRLAVIAFHSLEDRIGKHLFREAACRCSCPSLFPVCICGRKPSIRILTPRPLQPPAWEVEENPRARSARLRVVARL